MIILNINKFLIVGIFLLAIFSVGAVCAAENITANDIAVSGENVDFESPVCDELTINGDTQDGVAIGENLTCNGLSNNNAVGSGDKLGAAENDDVLSDKVDPQYTWSIDLPKQSTAYVAQWGQPIVVSANYTGATGNVTITFDGETYEGIPLVDGAFKYAVTKYSSINIGC